MSTRIFTTTTTGHVQTNKIGWPAGTMNRGLQELSRRFLPEQRRAHLPRSAPPIRLTARQLVKSHSSALSHFLSAISKLEIKTCTSTRATANRHRPEPSRSAKARSCRISRKMIFERSLPSCSHNTCSTFIVKDLSTGHKTGINQCRKHLH